MEEKKKSLGQKIKSGIKAYHDYMKKKYRESSMSKYYASPYDPQSYKKTIIPQIGKKLIDTGKKSKAKNVTPYQPKYSYGGKLNQQD